MIDHRVYDVAVIGGGILGCFAARNLTRYKIKTVLIEAAGDVCTGITRANSAIVYAGYDHVPGSLKADLTLRGNAFMEELCEELEVPFIRRGSLMTAEGPKGDLVLKKKLDQGYANGIAGLKLLSSEEAREMEPMLGDAVTSALWAPSTGTINPWQLGISACESALANGLELKLNTELKAIRRIGAGKTVGCTSGSGARDASGYTGEDRGADAAEYMLETNREEIMVRAVINCAGLQADTIREMLFPPYIRLRLDASDYLVFDKYTKRPNHILFQETEEKGKGITAVPTTEGNLLLESPARSLTTPFAAEADSLRKLYDRTSAYLPKMDLQAVIRNFGAVRPNPYYVKKENGVYIPEDRKITSFVIDRPEAGFVSLIGIKTPGLTCADQLGRYLAGLMARYLDAEEYGDFITKRSAIIRPAACRADQSSPDPGRVMRDSRPQIDPACSEIICQCEGITKGEIKEAIRRGAGDLNGIRRRLGLGMGTCQGSRCRRAAEKLLKEAGYGIF